MGGQRLVLVAGQTARGFRRPTLVALVVSASLSGCKPAATDTAAVETPPPDVSVATVTPATVPRLFDLPGRLASTRVAEVRAQVSGIIRERAFEEGSLVEKDDVLFRIDPAVYKAEVDAKAASLARAEASRVQALKQSERTETLLERQAASTDALPDGVADHHHGRKGQDRIDHDSGPSARCNHVPVARQIG